MKLILRIVCMLLIWQALVASIMLVTGAGCCFDGNAFTPRLEDGHYTGKVIENRILEEHATVTIEIKDNNSFEPKSNVYVISWGKSYVGSDFFMAASKGRTMYIEVENNDVTK